MISALVVRHVAGVVPLSIDMGFRRTEGSQTQPGANTTGQATVQSKPPTAFGLPFPEMRDRTARLWGKAALGFSGHPSDQSGSRILLGFDLGGLVTKYGYDGQSGAEYGQRDRNACSQPRRRGGNFKYPNHSPQ